MARRRSSSKGPLLLVLLALLAGFGGWNYHRNTQAEAAEYRPYRGYSREDLDSLVSAYRAEIDTYRKRYEAATGFKVQIRNASHIGQKVREFERVQRISRATREIGARLIEREAALERIQEEKSRRGREAQRVRLFLERVFVYRPMSSSSDSSSSASS